MIQGTQESLEGKELKLVLDVKELEKLLVLIPLGMKLPVQRVKGRAGIQFLEA
jgi:hypothetical protein